MRRTSLLLGALLLGGRTASAQTTPVPAPSFRPQAAQPSLNPGSAVNHLSPAAAPEAPVEVTENLTSFDGSRAQLVWDHQTWKLVCDGVVIKDFGRHESDARAALRLVQGLHLNQHGTVGDPPVMEYWLNDGHAPTGFAPGVRPMALDATSLKAEQSQGQWVVRDRQRVWYNFGLRGDEARQALLVMQKYAFTQVAPVGAPSPSMTVFLASAVRPGSGATTFRPPAGPPPDAAAALGGYVPPVLPPLRNVAAQPNQPTSPFRPQPAEGLSANPTSWRRSAPAATPGLCERVLFDWRQAQVRQEQGHWKLAAGNHVLGDFGTNAHTAAQALKAVQYYRFTEQCHVGQPSAHCSYFLVNGQPPRGIPFGIQGRPIDAEHLAVRQVGERYALLCGEQPLMQFGSRPDEARHMLDVIQHHRFDHVCRVGGPDEEGLTFLVKAR